MTTAVADAHDAHDEHPGPEKGIKRWLFTTNHKDIVPMSLWFVVNSQRLMPFSGPWCSSCASCASATAVVML